MKNKDLIIFLGPSGAGKTTSIQVCLGYKLKEGKINGLKTLVVDGKMIPEHEDFLTSPSSESCTRYIKAVKIPEKLIPMGQPTDIYIGDTAGFEDSAGSEVDASNGLATIRALQDAKSIRPILVINQKCWGARGEGLKKLAKIISRLFIKYDRNKIIFLLNCF